MPRVPTERSQFQKILGLFELKCSWSLAFQRWWWHTSLDWIWLNSQLLHPCNQVKKWEVRSHCKSRSTGKTPCWYAGHLSLCKSNVVVCAGSPSAWKTMALLMAPTGAALFMKFMDPGGPGGIIPPAAENEWLIFSALSKLLPGKGCCIAGMAGIGISVAKLWEKVALFGSRDCWAMSILRLQPCLASSPPWHQTTKQPMFVFSNFVNLINLITLVFNWGRKEPRSVTLGRFLASAILPELNRHTRHHEFH